jgi:hypothetical protein
MQRYVNDAVRFMAVVAFLAYGSAGAVAAEPQVTWNNVTLGAPVSALRARVGDPLRVLVMEDGATRVARYWLAGSPSTFYLVVEKRGYVEGINAFSTDLSPGKFENVPADPSGVRLGDTLESVKVAHPGFRSETAGDGTQQLFGNVASPAAGIIYEFQSGRVRSFHWATPIPEGLPDLPILPEPAGDTIATSILAVQNDEMAGVRWEDIYVAFHPCDGTTLWKLQHQALTHENGRAYDRLHVVCPATTAERDFFFDITSYYGKL